MDSNIAKDSIGPKQAVRPVNQTWDLQQDHAERSGVQTLDPQNIICMRSMKNTWNMCETSAWNV